MHLVTHAWFKAALFHASGSVIHAMHHAMHHLKDHHSDPQDINNMGGLRKTMPWTYRTFLFATLAIAGVPLTSGFLSKDGIIANTLAYASLTGGWHWAIPIVAISAAGMTAFYMFRLTIVAFHGKPKTEIAKNTHENKFVIIFPLILLATLSFWFFYSPNPIDATKGWFHQNIQQPASVVPADLQWDFLLPEANEEVGQVAVISTHAQTSSHTETAPQSSAGEHSAVSSHYKNKFQEVSHHFHYLAMFLSLTIAGLGILLAFIIYQFKLISANNLEKQFKKLHTFSLRKWYFDEIYYATVVAGFIGISKLFGWFDNKFVDGIVNLTATVTRLTSYFIGFFDLYVVDGFVNLTANVTGLLGGTLRKIQTGRVQSYVVLVLLGIIFLIYFLI
jgi:NADH-quinone oxidoreductase subunit L